MYGLQGFFSKIVLIVRIFSKIVRIFFKMYGFVQKNVRIVRISSENVRIFVRIFSKKFWPLCTYCTIFFIQDVTVSDSHGVSSCSSLQSEEDYALLLGNKSMGLTSTPMTSGIFEPVFQESQLARAGTHSHIPPNPSDLRIVSSSLKH